VGGFVGDIGGQGIGPSNNREELIKREQERLAKERFRRSLLEEQQRQLAVQRLFSERLEGLKRISKQAAAREAEMEAKRQRNSKKKRAENDAKSRKKLKVLREQDTRRRVTGEGGKKFRELVERGAREQARFKARRG